MVGRAWIAGLVATSFGCGSAEAPPPDLGADSGAAPVDSGTVEASDAASADGGSPDGGAPDGGLPDSGEVLDGGSDLHPDIVRVVEVPGRDPRPGWADSYSVDDACYCDSTFDHGIGGVVVETPAGPRTVRQVCEALGPGPGKDGRPLYNDIQCGNGPPNDAGDEHDCPGRVDIGREGCGHLGPLWDLSRVP